MKRSPSTSHERMCTVQRCLGCDMTENDRGRETFKEHLILISPVHRGSKVKVEYIRDFFAYSCKGPIVPHSHAIRRAFAQGL